MYCLPVKISKKIMLTDLKWIPKYVFIDLAV